MIKYFYIIRKYSSIVNENGKECPFKFESIRWLNSYEVILKNQKCKIVVIFYGNYLEIFLNQQKFMLKIINGCHGFYCQWYEIIGNVKNFKYHEVETKFIKNNEIEDVVDDYFVNILLAPWREEEDNKNYI